MLRSLGLVLRYNHLDSLLKRPRADDKREKIRIEYTDLVGTEGLERFWNENPRQHRVSCVTNMIQCKIMYTDGVWGNCLTVKKKDSGTQLQVIHMESDEREICQYTSGLSDESKITRIRGTPFPPGVVCL
jgi:hypothetical protein